MKTTETLDKIYLEWSQFTKAETATEIKLKNALRSIQRRAAEGTTVESAYIHQIINSALSPAPSSQPTQHVNGGAFRQISVAEWRELGGDANRLCDWHEGIGYVVYDDIAKEQFRAAMADKRE